MEDEAGGGPPLCGICQEELNDGDEIGELDACFHSFHHTCISRWAEIESKCPFCKERFATLRRKQLAPGAAAVARSNPNTELPGVYLDSLAVPERDQHVVFEDPDFQAWIEGVVCLMCGGGQDEDQLLLCDGCDRACHTYCTGLHGIPEGEWFCPECAAARGTSRGRRPRHGHPAQQQQRQAGRRRGREEAGGRRARVQAVVSEESEGREEESAVSRRRRRVAAGLAAARHGSRPQDATGGRRQRQGEDSNLGGWLVSGSEKEEEEWGSDARDVQPAAARAGGAAARGRGAARGTDGGGRVQRPVGRRGQQQRREGSEASEETALERWGGVEEEEADFTDSEEEGEEEPSSHSEGKPGRPSCSSDTELQPLVARLDARARRQGAGSSAAAASRPHGQGRRPRQRAGTARLSKRQQVEEEDEGWETLDQRRVSEQRRRWEELRAGSAAFPAPVQQQREQGNGAAGPRRRLRRLADARPAGPQGAARLPAQPAAEVVDLISPSPPAARRPAAAAEDEGQLAWAALDAARREQQQQQGALQVVGTARGRRRPSLGGSAAPARGSSTPSELDVPLAARLRQELAAARERGSRMRPRQSLGAPLPGSGHRTVGGMRWAAAVALGTPGGDARGHGGGSAGRQRVTGSGGAGGPGDAFRIPKRSLEECLHSHPGSRLQQQQHHHLHQEAVAGGSLSRANPFCRWSMAASQQHDVAAQPPSATAAGSPAPSQQWAEPSPAAEPAAAAAGHFLGHPRGQQHRPGWGAYQPAPPQPQPAAWAGGQQQHQQLQQGRPSLPHSAPPPSPVEWQPPPPPWQQQQQQHEQGSPLQRQRQQQQDEEGSGLQQLEQRQQAGSDGGGTPSSTGAGAPLGVIPDTASPTAPPCLQRTQHNQQQQRPLAAKQVVLDSIKPQLKKQMHAQRLTKEQYKQMSKRATHALLALGRGFSEQEAAAAVAAAATVNGS